MISPMVSTVCNHVFEKDAIYKYLEQKSLTCTICSFVNKDKSKLCTICGGALEKDIECPVFGCTKIVSVNVLIFDGGIFELIQQKKKKDKQRNQNEEDDDEDIVILNKDYPQKCPLNTNVKQNKQNKNN